MDSDCRRSETACAVVRTDRENCPAGRRSVWRPRDQV